MKMIEFHIIDLRSLGGRVEAWSRSTVSTALRNYNSYHSVSEKDKVYQRKEIVLNAPIVQSTTAQEAVEIYLSREGSQ